MKFFEAFKETVYRFDLKGSELAELSGLTVSQISRFRQGQNIRIETLERLLAAMPPEAQEYMLLLVVHGDVAKGLLPKKSEEEP